MSDFKVLAIANCGNETLRSRAIRVKERVDKLAGSSLISGHTVQLIGEIGLSKEGPLPASVTYRSLRLALEAVIAVSSGRLAKNEDLMAIRKFLENLRLIFLVHDRLKGETSPKAAIRIVQTYQDELLLTNEIFERLLKITAAPLLQGDIGAKKHFYYVAHEWRIRKTITASEENTLFIAQVEAHIRDLTGDWPTIAPRQPKEQIEEGIY